MEYALTLQNVSKTYDDFTLKDISLQLPAGCIMGFIGENGAGKSTTIRLILDQIARDHGKITILGKDNKEDLDAVKEHIGVVLDESNFPENLSAKDINTILKRIYRTWDEAKYSELIHRFSLPNNKPVKDYSKGMKMKLSIATALSHDSKLLILDEATSGLDPIVREEILDVFLEFIQDEQHSVFISSHITSDLEKICDYITFIHKGRIVFSEPKDELLETYGVLKCSENELAKLDPSIIKGVRKHQFGVEALVFKNRLQGSYSIDTANLETIMLFTVKEGAK
ncbi:ABC transporter ATP-binding protein [Paenibacillus sp. FSL R10-2734]|uniref:ABC transporter ATP-binding protein n=1 Tax=Paenibacillus sp. FSL R10-2734 TaxID=2954691 RepID=UPI0030DA5737